MYSYDRPWKPNLRTQVGADREGALDGTQRGVECGVETGHLRQAWPQRGERTYRGDARWLVQRRERGQCLDRADHCIVDDHRRDELLAAMHHAVTDGAQHEVVIVCVDPAQQVVECFGMAPRPAAQFAQIAVDDAPAGGIGHQEPGVFVEVFQLAAEHRRDRLPTAGEQRELQAGRAGIEGEEGVGHPDPVSTCRAGWR